MMGRREFVARAGASSTFVHLIFEVFWVIVLSSLRETFPVVLEACPLA
jgi:hypothetical protein